MCADADLTQGQRELSSHLDPMALRLARSRWVRLWSATERMASRHTQPETEMQRSAAACATCFAFIAASLPAGAHPGHVNEVSGHDHGGSWMIALVAIFAIAAVVALAVRTKR